MLNEIHHGDCLEVMRGMAENSVDAVVCDPPYGLFFMGHSWDKGTPPVPFWQEALRVAKPGAYLLAFGGTRTFHRLACAIEDAGWILRDTLSWNYGSGFPKSHDISKALDRRRRRDFVSAAIELGLIVPGNSLHDWTKAEHSPSDAWWEKFKAKLSQEQWESIERKVAGYNSRKAGWFHSQNGHKITTPATPEAEQWNGFGTALKPAWEPIILAQAPLEGTYAENVLKWGCGALNIDGCRIRHSNHADLAESLSKNPGRHDTVTSGTYGQNRPQQSVNKQGRWPANLLLSHSVFCEKVGEKMVRGLTSSTPFKDSSVRIGAIGIQGNKPKGHADPDGLETVDVWRCVPGCPARMLDEQSGETVTRPHGGKGERLDTQKAGWRFRRMPSTLSDRGGASRFFYCAKASRSERNAGLEGFEEKPSGMSGGAQGALSRGEDSYMQDSIGLNRIKKMQNNQPTVKPINLLRYLCRLVTPPKGKILDPFAGSGSTGCAAALEGFEFVGIEKEKGYVEIARARIKHWAQEVAI